MRLDTHPYSLQDCARQLEALSTLRECLLHRSLFLEAERAAYEALAEFPTIENHVKWQGLSAGGETGKYFDNRGQD